MDNLKQLIIKHFNIYLRKLQKGYPLDQDGYKVILDAMRVINAIENFTFPQYITDTVVSYYTLKLKTL